VLAQPAARRGRRVPVSFVVGVAILLLMLVCAVAPQWVAPYDPLAFSATERLKPPSATHWFGTDQFGRDVLSRTISAARIDLQMAIFGTIFPLMIGTLVGLYVGYVGGWADRVFTGLVDLVITFPFLVIVIAIVAILGPGLTNMYIAVGLLNWVFYARLMRGEVLVQRQSDYVASAKVLGFSSLRIAFGHIAPNCLRPILAYWVTDMALVILLGSSLGYLGLGAQPPQAEWGTLVAEAKNYFGQAPWMMFFPGLAVVICGVGFSMAGDGIADLLELKH
jgi:peptide/nickel transport system permease protein